MLRFTIRDMLWLTVVVGFATCWYLERDGRVGQAQNELRLYRENEMLRRELEVAKLAKIRAEIQQRRQAHDFTHSPPANSD